MPDNVLKMPEGVAPTGVVQDAAEAYVKAVIALPEILMKIVEEMESVADSLSVMALVAEKKGLSEGILSPDDLDKGEEDGKQPD